MTPDTLAHLHARAFSQTRAWSAKEFADLLAAPSTILLGDDRSFLLVRVVVDEAEILTIATDPAYRRQRLAKTLLVAGEGAASAAGATQMFLEVAEDNFAAKALYDAAGYKQVGRRPGYYVPKDKAGIAALLLRKHLPGE
ncbi:MAG: GNAT family N-acetyltransferase [Pseudomonadota bacterium]